MRPRCTKRKGFRFGSCPKWNTLADRQHFRYMLINLVKSISCADIRSSPGLHAVLVCQNSQLRDGGANQKSTLKRSLFESRFESRIAIRMGITRRWRCAAARIGLGK